MKAQRRSTGELKGKAKERYDILIASGIEAPAALRRVQAGRSWPNNATALTRLLERLRDEKFLRTRYKELVDKGGDPARAWACLHGGEEWPGIDQALATLSHLDMEVHQNLPPRPDQLAVQPQATALSRTHAAAGPQP